MSRILLAGESWSTTSIHTKGFDSFVTSVYEEGASHYIGALERAGHEVVFQPNHVAADHFPTTLEELDAFDVVVLSDIGANTLLLPGKVFVRSQRIPNRLQLLADWVARGGSLLMVGGYLSFQGIEAKANYRNTALADVLPVTMEVGDDRHETPEGPLPQLAKSHTITDGLPETWPPILGYHRFEAKPDADVLATVDGYPLLAVGGHGEGRVAAFGTDMGPHWLPQEFISWSFFDAMWQQLTGWLAAKTSDQDTVQKGADS